MAETDKWDGVDRRQDADTLRELTADIVAAHVANNSVAVNDLPQLIANVHSALAGLSPVNAVEEKPEPKVPIRSVNQAGLYRLLRGRKAAQNA